MSHPTDSRHFLLVGNGPYLNRGCEAIVRGTLAILRKEFGDRFRVTVATFETPGVVGEQAARESDPLIRHVSLRRDAPPRWSSPWWTPLLAQTLPPDRSAYGMLDPFCDSQTVGLQIGGDNFTLDYGLSTVKMFMDLDDHLKRRGVPVVLWGASVGPFEAEPAFAPGMFAHLRRLRAIMPRETDSCQYLREHGVADNLHRMSDPAFAMDAVEPPAERIGCAVPPGAIGLNLSPLMARYVTARDLEAWVHASADIVRSVVAATGRDVLLIPHVTWAKSDDRAFLRRVLAACPAPACSKVLLADGDMPAAELKWIISRCAVFAGARTHSTIAAISSGVPTLSLAYSRKARGLNQDVFGRQDYCVQPTEITPAGIAQRIANLLDQETAIREYLARALPPIRQMAFQAGALLRRLMEDS